MDFFEAQARAKRRTSRLVFLFALAVLGVIAACYLVAAFVLAGHLPRSGVTSFWDWRLLGGTTVAVCTIVGGAMLFKWLQLRAGGAAIAEMVGGRRVHPQSTDLAEQRLLNIVEEMAIASGLPMPGVYLLEDEPALNAFAAGLTTGDAVVAVTRGSLEKLSRDELQGVVAHEFSHILNGDMRLNVRLTAVLFGILVLGLMGRGLLRSLFYGRVRIGGSGKNKGSGAAAIFGLGLALLIIGYIGYFFGRVIQAAISRQREFLADAAAVQFTRNPSGIAGALKKIGGYALGSRMESAAAGQIGHFFFAQGFRSGFSGLWATHPPLEQRIRTIDPSWDGKFFAPPTTVDIARESFPTVAPAASRRPSPLPPAFAPTAAHRPAAPRRIPFQPAAALAQAGLLTEQHFTAAQTLLAQIPLALRGAARDSAQAPALVCGLLLDTDPAMAARQLALVQQQDAAWSAVLDRLLPACRDLAPATRLPLLQLCLPALRFAEPAALHRFLSLLDELVHADGQVSPFEFALQRMLVRHLQLAAAPNTRVDFYSFQAVADDIAVVLSGLAHLGGADQPEAAAQAFTFGAAQLKLIEARLELLAPEACALPQLSHALDRLAAASLPIKKRTLLAAATVIGHDGSVSVAEDELFRALSAALDVPLPVAA